MPNLNISGINGDYDYSSTPTVNTNNKQITQPTVTTGAKSTTEKIAKKTQKAITEEYIEGTIQLIPSPRIMSKKIYGVDGVGSVFSGKYYTKKVRHSIGSDGYTVEGDVLKVSDAPPPAPVAPESPEAQRPEPVKPEPPKAPEQPKFKTITIQRGDCLYKLARKYNTTVAELAKVNNIKNPNLIYAGAPLKVPS